MWIWLSLLLLVLLGSSYLLSLNQPKEYPVYASDSPSPTGVKAFYSYLENHQGVKRWTDSPNQLPTNPEKQLLIIIEPYFIPDSEELSGYESFMDAGNTILLFKENPKGMFGLDTKFTEPENSIVWDRELSKYHAEVSSKMRLQNIVDDEVLLSDDAGTIALKRSVGDGQLIVSIAPKWMINGEILIDDHLALVLSLVNEGNATSVIFDEYIHQTKGATSVFTVYPRWFLLLFIQGALLTILWLWTNGKRFGPIFIPREETVRFSDEGVRALAAWYLRGRRYQDSLRIQADYVRVSMQERWSISFLKEWSDLANQLERKWPEMPKALLASLLNELPIILAKEEISKHEFLFWSKKLEIIRRKVEQE